MTRVKSASRRDRGGPSAEATAGRGPPAIAAADFAFALAPVPALPHGEYPIRSRPSGGRNLAQPIGNRLFTHEPYGIALRQDDSAFRLLVDQTLTETYQSDDFANLLTTYFGEEGPILRREIMMQSIPQ